MPRARKAPAVAIVTDSTASLPPELAAERGIVVVPLQVVIGATVYDEGADGATPELVAAALREWKPVSTSRPSPAALLGVYEQAARDELANDELRETVIGLENHAREVGVTGVPFFIIDGKLAVSGAQPPDVWDQVFQQVLSAQQPEMLQF